MKSFLKRNKKGQGTIFLGILIVGLIITAAAIFVPRYLAQKQLEKEDWSGRIVKYQIDSSRMLTGAEVNPTYSIYSSEPTDWLNPRGDQGTADSTYTSTNGTATLGEVPGEYWVKGVLSNYYTEFFTVTVPSSSGTDSLSDYNQAPEIKKVQYLYVETLTVTDIDMSITTNTTDKEMTAWGHYSSTDDQGFKLWKVKAKMGDADFNEDTDADGIYDEGIKKVEISVEGNSKVLFDSSKNIDLFGADNEYDIDLEALKIEVADGKGVLDVKIYVKADTLTEVVADDEKFGNGENPLDLIIVDVMGNALTTVNVNG